MDRREAARLGGQAVSQDREHMSQIGRKGGQTVSQNKAHMAEIGRRGGSSKSDKRFKVYREQENALPAVPAHAEPPPLIETLDTLD